MYNEILDKHSDELRPDIITEAINVLRGHFFIDVDEQEAVDDFIVDVLTEYPITTIMNKEPYQLMELIYNKAFDIIYNKGFGFFSTSLVYNNSEATNKLQNTINSSPLSQVVVGINSLENNKPNDYITELFSDTDYNHLQIIIDVKDNDYFNYYEDWPELRMELVNIYNQCPEFNDEVNWKNDSGRIILFSVNKKSKNVELTKKVCQQLDKFKCGVTNISINTGNMLF